MTLLGSELVTEGNFGAGGAAWTADPGTSWDVTGGNAFIDASESGGVYQSIASLVSGKTYYLTCDVTIVGAVIPTVTLGGGGPTVVTNGSFNATLTASSTNTRLNFTASTAAGQTVTIDNVSLKELSVADEIEKAIFDVLRLNATVAGLVGARIYPQIIPQNTALPAIAYSQIAGIRNHTLASTDDMVSGRWQFTVVAETFAELRALSDAVRGALDNLDNTIGTVVIQCAHFIDENDLTGVVAGTDELRRYMKAIDFYIYYNE